MQVEPKYKDSDEVKIRLKKKNTHNDPFIDFIFQIFSFFVARHVSFLLFLKNKDYIAYISSIALCVKGKGISKTPQKFC